MAEFSRERLTRVSDKVSQTVSRSQSFNCKAVSNETVNKSGYPVFGSSSSSAFANDSKDGRLKMVFLHMRFSYVT